MNIKEIVEGMTAPQVAQVIKDNFNEVDKDKANKTDLNKSISDLESVVEANKTDLTKKIDNNKEDTDEKLSELGSEVETITPEYFLQNEKEVPIAWIDGEYYNIKGEVAQVDGWKRCEPFDIPTMQVGERLYVTTSAVNKDLVGTILFYDSFDNIIKVCNFNDIIVNYRIILPTGAAKLAFSSVEQGIDFFGYKKIPTKVVIAKPSSVKEYIDEEISELASEVDSITPEYFLQNEKEIGINWVDGEYYDKSGLIKYASGWKRSEPIELSTIYDSRIQGLFYTTSGCNQNIVSTIIYYDDYDNIIKTLSFALFLVNYRLIPPSNAKKVAFSANVNAASTSLGYKQYPTKLVVAQIGYSSTQKTDETIDTIGDSLTQAGIYQNELMNLIKGTYAINNWGVGGDSTVEVGGRTGDIPMYVAEDVIIPTSVTRVEIKLGTTGVCLYDKFYPGRQKNENWVNPYKLGDVEGVITHEGQPSIFSEDHRYYFTRIKEGESYVCKNKEIIIPSNYNDNQNHIKIIWVGTNDANQNGINKFNLDNYIKEVKCLIGTTKRFLILALTAKPRFVDSIDDINARLQLEFGVHFVNIRDYILEYGLEDAGVVGTADDNEKISQGYMPPSLMETNDNIHFNDSGYRIVGRQVYIRGKKLGYWN